MPLRGHGGSAPIDGIPDSRQPALLMAAIADVLADPGLGSPGTLGTLYHLLTFRNRASGTCWPRVSTLSAAMGCSDRAVERRLNQLETTGIISRINRRTGRGRYTSSVYCLSTDPPAAVMASGARRQLGAQHVAVFCIMLSHLHWTRGLMSVTPSAIAELTGGHVGRVRSAIATLLRQGHLVRLDESLFCIPRLLRRASVSWATQSLPASTPVTGTSHGGAAKQSFGDAAKSSLGDKHNRPLHDALTSSKSETLSLPGGDAAETVNTRPKNPTNIGHTNYRPACDETEIYAPAVERPARQSSPRLPNWLARLNAVVHAEGNSAFVCPDDGTLIRAVRTAARGPVGSDIVASHGLAHCRAILIAIHRATSMDAQSCLAVLAAIIGSRIADRNRRLNGWGMIGAALHGAIVSDTLQTVVYHVQTGFTASEAARSDAIHLLRSEDRNCILAPQLLKRPGIDGLLIRVDRWGPVVWDVVRSVLAQNLIDGVKAAGAIRTWNYFDPQIEAEAITAEARLNGLGPHQVRALLRGIKWSQ